MSFNNLASFMFSVSHATPKALENWRYSTRISSQHSKQLCDKDPDNWDQYLDKVLTSYCVPPHLTTGETPFFLIYGRDPHLPLHQLLESMQHSLGNSDSGCLNLEIHSLALAIAMKTLDENRFRNAQGNRPSCT